MKDMGPSGLILFKAKVDLQWLIIMFVGRKQRRALFLIWSLNQMTPWTVLETPLCCFVQFQGTGNCFGLPLDKLTYSYSYLSSQGHMLVLCYLASAQWWNQSKMNCWWRAKYYFLFFFKIFIHVSIQSQICPLCLHTFCIITYPSDPNKNELKKL